MSDAQDWIDDLTEPSDSEDSTSLFEENFRKLVEDGDLDDMTVSTLENQVNRIDDPEILSEAMDVDDRTTAQDVYQDRIAEINAEDQDNEQEDSSDETDEVDQTASEETEDEAEEEETVDDVVNDILDEDDEELTPEDEPDQLVEDSTVDPEEDADEDEAEDDEPQTSADETPQGDDEEPEDDVSGLPDVDVASLAPDAVSREAAAEREKQKTLLVWGPEGSGKSHIAHSAPEPICYIDTEGKADEIAEKFEGKRIHYFVADDYKEAKAALDQALDVLAEYLDAGYRGTLVVDSMTAMWEYAKVDYAKFAYQTDNLSEVNFQSELEGSKDWTKIKARHNEEFREEILESPYHVVFTSGEKEAYGEVFEGGETKVVPDGEKWNKYAVKDVVRLRRNDEGKTVADLRKAALTRYSFVGLEWPTWEKVYDAVEQVYNAETMPQEVDVSNWDFGVVDGQPVGNPSDGSDEEEEDDGD